jgi:hypothetical protein
MIDMLLWMIGFLALAFIVVLLVFLHFASMRWDFSVLGNH